MKVLRALLFVFTMVTSSELIAQIALQADLLQNIGSRDKETLDGNWEIIIDPLENGFYNHRYKERNDGYFLNEKMEEPSDLIEYDFDSDLFLKVPGDWNTQQDKLYYYEGTVWYKKEFKFSPEDGQLNFLYFEAANYKSIVYLNGKKIGTHEGGYTPFQFEVSEDLIEGSNLLVVKVDNKRLREAIPTINTDWWNYGGITRSVHLVNTPIKHINDYLIQLNNSSTNEISGWVSVKNARDNDKVTISIPELKKSTEISLNDGFGQFTIKAKPKLWSPQNPKLYEVQLSIGSEQLTDEIAFRTIKTEGTKILLNEEEIFLKGISIHEEAPFKTGRVVSVEECRILLQWAKELGCNFVRLAHYPHSEAMVREAEKMGFLVWSEIPVYWTVLFDNPSTYTNAQNQLTEMITRDKNRGAVILWSVANETPEGTPRLKFLSSLAEHARKMDNTRLITAALDTQGFRDGAKFIEDPLGEVVDVIGINNYCGWYSGEPEDCGVIRWASDFNKPMIMSEVGGGALQGMHGASNERWTEEYQAAVYENNIEMMENIDFLAGVSPWILMDFRSARRHLRRIQMDFNRKGLISEQGIKKKSFYILRDYYRTK